MHLHLDGVTYDVPADVEAAGALAIRAWIADQLPAAHAALALGEPAPAPMSEED